MAEFRAKEEKGGAARNGGEGRVASFSIARRVQMAPQPSLGLFEEEDIGFRRSGPLGPSPIMARKEQARKFLPPWPATAVCVLVGMILGRLLLPYPTLITPDFSNLRRAAPTAPDYRAVLASDEALPESVANNLRLTHDECDAGFPLLWGEVTRTRDQFVRRGSVVGITLKDLQESEVYDGTRVRVSGISAREEAADALMQVAIIDNRMYVKRFHAESASRNQAVLASLYEAVSTAPE